MTKDQLLKLPLWQYTGELFLELLDSHFVKTTTATESVTSDENVATTAKRWLVYGIKGLCELLQCSKATAHRIKNSGVIKDAITQSGRRLPELRGCAQKWICNLRPYIFQQQGKGIEDLS